MLCDVYKFKARDELLEGDFRQDVKEVSGERERKKEWLYLMMDLRGNSNALKLFDRVVCGMSISSISPLSFLKIHSV